MKEREAFMVGADWRARQGLNYVTATAIREEAERRYPERAGPKVGDLVRLKSGGPTMTVVARREGEAGEPLAFCVWHDEHDIARSWAFPPACLELMPPLAEAAALRGGTIRPGEMPRCGCGEAKRLLSCVHYYILALLKHKADTDEKTWEGLRRLDREISAWGTGR